VWNPGAIASLTGQGTTQVRLDRIGNGTATLTVDLTKTCGINQKLSKSYTISAPVIDLTYSMNGSCNGGYQTWSMNASSTSAVSSWQWTVDNPSSGSWYIHNPSSPSTLIDVMGGGGVSITATSSCGTSRNGATIYSNCPTMMLVASPNPTMDNVTISSVSTKDGAAADNKKTLIYQIKVTDQSGTTKRQYRYPSGLSNTTISLRGLMNGVYVIQAFDGTSWSSVQVIKK
jgi:hypothetical protein